MLKYLVNKKFIGDLSLQDADTLSRFASTSTNILEFGVGGSTQLFMQAGAKALVSVDTDKAWVDVTKTRLEQIKSDTEISFLMYDEVIPSKVYDLIFVDGYDHDGKNLRMDFATKTWDMLAPDGVMLFHDTRVAHHAANVMDVTKRFYEEVATIDLNIKASNDVSSNISVIYKKPKEVYVNWNYEENKPDWAYGRLGHDPKSPLWEYR